MRSTLPEARIRLPLAVFATIVAVVAAPSFGTESLAQDGFVTVLVNRDTRTGKLSSRPRLISRGFVFLPDADELLAAAQDVIIESLADSDADWERLIQSRVGQFLYSETKRRPVIIPVVNDIPG